MGSLGLIASNVQLLSCILIGCISMAWFKSANCCNVLGRLLIRLFSFILKAALETQAVKANCTIVQLVKSLHLREKKNRWNTWQLLSITINKISAYAQKQDPRNNSSAHRARRVQLQHTDSTKRPLATETFYCQSRVLKVYTKFFFVSKLLVKRKTIFTSTAVL